LSVPPAFWAKAACPEHIVPSIAPTTAAIRKLRVIASSP
jgi:hypothetical protein